MPFIARWPGRIQPGTKSDHVCALWDFMPTCAELLGEQPPTGIDGVSILPTLLGRSEQQRKHRYLYWELDNQQAVRMDDWKAIRLQPAQNIQLFNLKTDLSEQKDVAAEHPDLVARFAEILASGRTDSEVFPLKR